MAISPITCDPKTTLNTPETTSICAPFSARNSMCSDPPAGGGCLLLTPEQKSPGLQGQAGSSLSHSPRAVAPVHTQRWPAGSEPKRPGEFQTQAVTSGTSALILFLLLPVRIVHGNKQKSGSKCR